VLAVALLLAVAVPPLAASPAAAAAMPAPVAAGVSAGNIDLNSADRRVLVRWVARSTGTLTALHLRIQADGASCRQSGRTGYGLGNGGSWHVTTHPVLPDGRPDQSATLATQDFRPCEAALDVADVRQGIVRLAMRLDVTKGAEYATVIANADAAPSQNYTSANFLFTSTGLLGANGRNERSALADDAYYGLDPRELVGFSRDGGKTWALPGGPYGLGKWTENPNFLPTYLQEYADGQITGQPYYYTAAASTADRTMVFSNITQRWVIRQLGAYTPTAGSGRLTLTVDGREAASAPVSGTGMLRAPIAPVTVSPGQVVRVTASGLTIQNIVADTAWGRLMGLHLASTPWKVEGEPNFSQAAPVYALPAYGTPEPAPPVVTPPAAATPPATSPPPAADPPAATPPAPTPPAPDPPAATPAAADPPAATPPTSPPTVTPAAAETPPAAPTPPAVDPPVSTPPVATPPAVDPPVATPPAATPASVDPPSPTPSVIDLPIAAPPVALPPVVVPRPVTPPVVKPPVVKPPVVRPPVVRPPVVRPPVVRPPVVRPPAKCRRRARGRASYGTKRPRRASRARCAPRRTGARPARARARAALGAQR
jgi:hypothetical protein